jgi:hypothetical protein
MSDQMNPMGPAEPEIMSQDGEDVIGLQPGQSDREGAMAKADLYKIANYSHKLFKQIEDQDQMEAWVQAKITKAADYIASVYHYLEYEMKFSQYGQALEDSGVYSESQKRAIKNRLMEAKEKVKELKLKQAKKVKADADEKVSEGILSGGHKSCTECGGSGMVYEEPKAIPDHVKGKVEKYNRQAKAFHAASKRLDRNKNGIPDDEEMEEGFGETDKDELKVGQKKKTRTGELERVSDTTTRHTNTSYKDEGDEIAANARSGKGKASHAKAQSAEDKAKRAPAQKQSPKSAKTWGKKDGVNFDNRDGAPAKPKKEKEEELEEGKKKGDGNLANNAKPYDKVTKGDVIAGRLGKDEKGGKTVKEAAKQTMSRAAKGHEKYGKEGMAALAKAGKEGKDLDKVRDKYNKYDESVESGDKKPCPPMSHIKKMCQDGKSVAEICKMHPDCDQKELKQMVADCKKKMDESMKAVAMWNSIKETQAYIAEKSAVQKKDKPTKGNKVADEGNAYGLAVKNTPAGEEIKINGKGTGDIKKESADLTRMKEFLTRLNG